MKNWGQVATKVLELIGNEYSPVAIDANGIGASVFDSLYPYLGDAVEPVHGQGMPQYSLESATSILKYVNKRAELYWCFRKMLDPSTGLNMALPPDEQLRADLMAPTYKIIARGLLI